MIRLKDDPFLGCCAGLFWYKFTDVSEVIVSSITRAMMTSVYFRHTTRHYNPEDSHHLTRRRENLRSPKPSA
jgi:hypothetical protein